jgi:hypothetical protein
MPPPKPPTASDRQAAHIAVRMAVRSGRLPPLTECALCGGKQSPNGRNVEYHHHSYAPEHWLDVIAVDRACHRKIHAGTIPEPATGTYRRKPWGLTLPETDELLRQILPMLAEWGPPIAPEHRQLWAAVRARANTLGLVGSFAAYDRRELTPAGLALLAS